MRCFIPDCLERANYRVWRTNKRQSMCFGHGMMVGGSRNRMERLWTP
jgi:hypothetical protein